MHIDLDIFVMICIHLFTVAMETYLSYMRVDISYVEYEVTCLTWRSDKYFLWRLVHNIKREIFWTLSAILVKDGAIS